jgi:hypothetical protein
VFPSSSNLKNKSIKFNPLLLKEANAQYNKRAVIENLKSAR